MRVVAASTLETGLGAGTEDAVCFNCRSRYLIRILKHSASEAAAVEAGLLLDAPSCPTLLICTAGSFS